MEFNFRNIVLFLLGTISVLIPASQSFAFGGPSEQKDTAQTSSEAAKSQGQEASGAGGSSGKKNDVERQVAYIAVKGPLFETKREYPRSDIVKVAMDEIIRTQKFELVFSSTQAFRDANYLFFELHMRGKEVVWGQGQKGFDMDFFLFNGKTGKLVTESHRERIFDRHLQYTARVMLYEIFYGKEIAQKKAAAAKLKENEKEQNIEKEEPETKTPQEKIVEPPQEKVSEKKTDEEKQEKKKPGKAAKPEMSIPQKTPPELAIPKKPKPPEEEEEEEKNKNKKEKEEGEKSPPKSPENKDAAAAPKEKPPEKDKPEPKEKPEKLAEEIQAEMKEQISKLKKKKKTLEDEIKENEKEAEAIKDKKADPVGEEGDYALTAQAAQPQSSQSNNASKTQKHYTVAFDFLVQQVNSTDLISVSNTFTHVGVNGTAFLVFDPKSEDALKINLRITQVVQSGEYKVPGMKQLGVVYRKSIPILNMYPSFGFEYETQSFVNLNTQGGGLAVNANKLLWYKGNIELVFHAGWRRWGIFGGMARTFVGSTDYGGNGKTVSIDGSRIEGGMKFEVLRGAYLELLTQISRMQSQGLSNLVNDQTTMIASLVYPL